MVDKSQVVGVLDGNNIYMFENCYKYCVDIVSGKVYTREGTNLSPTFFVYNEAVQFTYASSLTYNVILDKRCLTIEGHTYRRFYQGRKQIDTLDGVEYKIYSLSGIDFDAEKLKGDVAIRHFISRLIPDYDYTNLDEDRESSYIVKYKGYLGLSLDGKIIIEDELQSGKLGLGEVRENDDIKQLNDALRLIFFRRVVSKVDECSAVDIIKEDRALCFEEVEDGLSKHLNSINLGAMTKRLGLAKDTLYGLKRKMLESDNKKNSSKKKMSIYRIAFAYLVATNKSISK